MNKEGAIKKRLFESGMIGKLCLKNRIVMAPMNMGGQEPDGRISQQAIDYFVARAKGGTGLIITGASRVSRETEQPHNNPFARVFMVDNRIYISRLTQLAEDIHDYGSRIAVQLTAGVGRVAGKDLLESTAPVAPSPLPCFWDPKVTARELTTEEIKRLVQSFELAAALLKSAGIDAIELHGHEGYLFDQFTTALWNKRTDNYGGDLDGRLRFSVEVIQAIKSGAGTDFPVIYRIGLTHYLQGGREIEEGLEIARRLEAAGVDALDIDAGCYETWYWAHPPTTQPMGCAVDLAAMTRKVVRIPVMTSGKLGDPDLAEKSLQEGKADFIMLGRPLLADPEWPNKVKDGRGNEIRPCIGDHECFKRIGEKKLISCAVNPAVGQERELTVIPADKKKTVLVIGGGPGGLEAARVSVLRGHKVILWEKKDTLGGHLATAAIPDFKLEYKKLLSYLIDQLKKLEVIFEFNKEATLESVQELKPDVVFIATGSKPNIPKIPGMGKDKAVTAIDALLDQTQVGSKVIVLGGGFVGCETALHLAILKKNVTVVEITDSILRDMFLANRMHLVKLLKDAGVRIMTDTALLEKRGDGFVVRNNNGEIDVLPAETLVIAVGFKGNRELFLSLKDRVPEVYAIGDSFEPRKVKDAIWDGFRKARLI